MTWNKPQYNKSSFKTILTIKKDEKVVFRILPPMKSLGAKGIWSQLHKQHFGYSIASRNDPAKKFPATFYCLEKMDFRTKELVETCPECNLIKDRKAQFESAKKSFIEKGATPEQAEASVQPLVKWLKEHNLDTKFYINVKLQDGTFTTMKFPIKAKKDLDKLINDLVHPTVNGKKSIDPIDAEQGVWFEIARTGVGLRTEYTVKVVNDLVTAKVGDEVVQLEKPRPAPLSQQEAALADESCYDLSDVGIRRLSRDRVDRLVRSNGSPQEIEAIFGVAERTEASPEPAVSAPVVSSQLVTAVQQPAPAPIQTPAPQSAPMTSGGQVPEMSEEEFLRTFGPKNR